jgi:hypothetical protein
MAIKVSATAVEAPYANYFKKKFPVGIHLD